MIPQPAGPARRALLRIGAAAGVVVLGACGGAAPSRATIPSSAPAATVATSVPDGDWARFDFNAQRSGVGPSRTGITRGNLRELR